MTKGRSIEIPLSKSRLVLMIVGSIVFVAIGLWFVIAPPEIENSYWGDPSKLAVVGYASLLFFGICGFVIIRKLPDTKPGMIIDDTGITDNSSGLSAGHIPWTDIEDISVFEIQKHKLIRLKVKDPEAYIKRQTALLKRKGMVLNLRMYGSPVIITANSLKISPEELFVLIKQRLEEKNANIPLHSEQ